MGIDITFKSNLPEVMRKIDATAKDRMQEAVQAVRNQALETLSGSRSGRTYKVPGTSRTYTASSPGEPPAVATAELRQSVKGVVEKEGNQIVGMVGTDKIQGKMLEFGTKYIEARPWLRKSFEESGAKVKEIFTRLWF